MSQAEYEDFNLRQAVRQLQRQAEGNPEPIQWHKPEADLHEFIIEKCKLWGWIALHGSMAHRTFRTVGEPDFVIVAEGRVLFIECKSAKGKLTLEQEGMRRWFDKLGHTYHVIRSPAEFLELLGREA